MPNPNSEIHSAEAVPGARPFGETGRAVSLPSRLLTLNLPALWVIGGPAAGAAATLPNELAGTPRIAAYPGGGPGGNVPGGPPIVAVGNELPSAAGTAPPPADTVGAPPADTVGTPPPGTVAVPTPAGAAIFC